MPHTSNLCKSIDICSYFSVFWSVIFHTMFNQTRQSSVNAADTYIHLLIPGFIHIFTKLPFLMYLLNYSFTDGSILPGIHLQTDWKTSVISVSSSNGYCFFIFQSILSKSWDGKTQIFSQLKITSKNLLFLFCLSHLLQMLSSARRSWHLKLFQKKCTERQKYLKNLSHLRR